MDWSKITSASMMNWTAPCSSFPLGAINFNFAGYILLKKDEIEIHFFEFKSLNPLENYGQVYIRVLDIEGLYKDLNDNTIYDDINCPPFPIKNTNGCFCKRDLNRICKFEDLPEYKLNEEDIKKILEIAENSNIGQIAKDALDISATQILEEEEYSFSDNK